MEHSINKVWRLAPALIMLAAAALIPLGSIAQTSPGENLFQAKCASCHGADGAGKTPMGTALKLRDLRSQDVQNQSDAELTRIVAKGKNKMPAFDGKLKKDQIDQVVGYVRELGKKR
jgi:mono/diheme cytochrome c family protein